MNYLTYLNDRELLENELEWLHELEARVNRSSKDYIKWVQRSLNRIMGIRLAVDGIRGSRTRNTIRAFQRRARITVDGKVGPQTERALVRAGATAPPGSSITPSPQPTGGSTANAITYSVVSGREYGGKWRRNRPPGLPSWVRKSSARGTALPYVERLAREQRLGNVFVKTIIQMARTESGGTFALPANIFDARPSWERPSGKGLITAWGVFQFNRDAWTPLIPEASRRSKRSWVRQDSRIGCRSRAGCVFSWDTSPYEEIALPIRKYAELFRRAKNAGGSNLDAARGLRLWHISPAAYRQWLNSANERNFNVAWQRIEQRLRNRINRFLEQAGVL
ncbi:MAG: peptidoglycan-binding protein [Prochloraceae cyanobacterium]